jgi:hypothetical protein
MLFSPPPSGSHLRFLSIWLFGLDWSGCPTYHKSRHNKLSLVSKNFKIMQRIKMDHSQLVIVAAAALCNHQLLAACMTIFDDVPTSSEARATKTRRHELTSYKRNLSVTYGCSTANLEHIPHLEWILQDITYPYMKNTFMDSDYLKDLIERPRWHPDGMHPAINPPKKCKMDHYHHLYY